MTGAQGADQLGEIHLSVPAIDTYARVARLTVTGLATRVGFSYDEIEDMRIAVGEMCGVLLAGGPGRLSFRCDVGNDSMAVEATLEPVSQDLRPASDLARQILDAVVDEVDIDVDRARIRILKRRGA